MVAGIAGNELYGRRLGVLGGTFDPVHNGHLTLAVHVLAELGLDSILFIPAARPPHKGHVDLAPFPHRLAMLELAVLDNSRFFVSAMEAQRSGPSYSIDTLKELRASLGEEVLLFFIIGMDAFAEIETWKDYERLPDHAELVVIDRPDYPLSQIAQVAGKLGRYCFDPDRSFWEASDRSGRIYPIAMPPIEISSTDVRKKALSGESLTGLVPVAVAQYIETHGLFNK